MKVTLTPTATIDKLEGRISARIWEGETESGIPVKVWISSIQPQTHDARKLAEFDRELKELPRNRELVSFDLRMVT